MPTAEAVAPRVQDGRHQARILVVDDEPEVVALVTEGLSAADPTWAAEGETDPERALDRLTHEPFDCLITDLVMPTLDGLTLAERARAANEHLAVIAITACPSLDRSVEALRRGFDDFLEKPFHLPEVARAVARAIEVHRQRERREERLAELAQAKTRLETERAEMARKLDLASHDLVLSSRRLARRLDEVAARADLARLVMGVIELEDLLGLCAEVIADRVPCRSVTVALYEPGEAAVGLLVRARPEADDPPALSWLRQPLTAGVMVRAAQSGRAVHVAAVEESPLLDHQERTLWPEGRLLAVPIPCQGVHVGVVVLHRADDDPDFGASDVRTVTLQAQTIAPAIQTAKVHHRQRCQMYAALERVVEAVERRDGYLKGHSARVMAYAMPVGEALEVPQAQMGAIQIAARLHDIGRLAVPDSAVNHPGPLDETQWDLVRRHPDAGAEFLGPLEFFGEVGDAIRAHHESYDGTGYPRMLAGEEIPLVARIVAVADAFDAMTSPRPYREPLDTAEALEQIRRLAGQQFDPRVAQAFLSLPLGVLSDIRTSHR